MLKLGNILVQIRNGKAYPVLLDYGMCRELSTQKKLAFASMIFAATTMDFGTLLSSFEAMGLKLKRDDPFEDMKNIRFVLRDTAPGAEMRRDLKKFREDIWQKRQSLPRSQRNPVEAWPPELLFFFRVTLLLRGLCAVLGVRLRYSLVLAPYAQLALIRAYDRAEHAKQLIYPECMDPPNLHESNLGPHEKIGNVNDAGKHEQDQSALDTTAELARELGNTRLLHDATNPQRAAISVLRDLYDEGLITGIQVAVYHRGACVVSTCAGTLGTTDPRPVQPDSLFNCFSVVKGIAAAALHILADQRLLQYTDTVGYHWPKFACNGKKEATILHVLTHTAGLHSFPGTTVSLEQLCTWPLIKELLENAAPDTPPGQFASYHILSFGWIIAGIIEQITKQPFQQFLRQRIAIPLEIEVNALKFYLPC